MQNDESQLEAQTEAGPPLILVDVEGEWFHQGNRIFRQEILDVFYENIQRDGAGRYQIEWKGSRCEIHAEDTPFVVTDVELTGSQGSKGSSIQLRLRHIPDHEVLDPSSLRVGSGNVLYCTVRSGRFPARFSRPAYYRIAEFIAPDETGGGFHLQLDGRRFSIMEGNGG